MLKVEKRMLVKADADNRVAFIDAAVAAYFGHPRNRITAEGGFRLSIATLMHRLYDEGIYENEDVWLILDSLYRDDLTPLGQLRMRKVLSDPMQSPSRKMRAVREILGAPVAQNPLH
ncbi:hypothetical protein [Yoonia sp. 2307UL14-13]|uniref:hypothetical protein n=1 Tax=Yoonia sp. 2307UL14-13 TaxID=3126506 RepID=UPI0030973B08